MKFRYTARTTEGKRVRGVLVAEDHAAAESQLLRRGYRSAVLREEAAFFVRVEEFFDQFQRPKTGDVVVFLRQFAVMVAAKMPIVSALRSLIHSTANPPLRAILVDLVRDVESGRKLSDAFGAHPRVFSAYAVHLIRAGETTGKLEEVLGYLADQAERDEELRAKVRSAMVYPAFILSGLAIVAAIMMTFVVPRLTSVLQETGAKLPWMTRALIAVSSFLASWWWLLLAMIVIVIVIFRVALRSPVIRTGWDGTKLRLPVIGALTRDVAVVRVTRSFELLLRGGVDIVPALEVVRGVVGNAAYASLLDETTREVRDGNSITTLFRDSPLIPQMVTQLIDVGEETGQLDEVLARLASHYERVVERRVRDLVTIIEPIVMILLGVTVGIMVAAIIMPMYNLASQF